MSKKAADNSNKHDEDEDDHAVYHLQVQTAGSAQQEDGGEEGCWQDAGPIRLWKDGADPSTSSSSTGAERSSALSTPRQLPKHAKAFLRLGRDAVPRPHIYLYRNTPSPQQQPQPNTNLLVLLHGAGGNHGAFDKLARQMALPQTATVSLAAFESLPWDLGTTWFQEMDYNSTTTTSAAAPLYLAASDPVRRASLDKAVQWLVRFLEYCTTTTTNNEPCWPSERVFLLGYGAGACLAMETCAVWSSTSNDKNRPALGGAVCVGGGLRPTTTTTTSATKTAAAAPIQLMVGERDDYFSPRDAERAAGAYPGSEVRTHVQPGKGPGRMIECEEEMRVVMQFLADKLVRQQQMPRP